jgi:hypothetical protein
LTNASMVSVFGCGQQLGGSGRCRTHARTRH